MKATLKTLQDNSSEHIFKFDELCPYPFHKSIIVMPFPKLFEKPKFDKYKGKGDPHYHVKEFFMAYQEVSWCDNYLLWLFLKSLSRPPGNLLLNGFPSCHLTLSHCSLTYKSDLWLSITKISKMMSPCTNLCQTKQKDGESLLDYVQRWRALIGQLPCTVSDTQLVLVFIYNLHPKMVYHIWLNYASAFKDVMSKGPLVEQDLIDEGIIKLYKEYSNKPSHKKQWYWNKNKNVVGDGVTDSKILQMIMVAKPFPQQTYVNTL